MIYDIHDRAQVLQWRIDELEDNINFMEDVKLDLEKNGKVDKRDLEEWKGLGYDSFEDVQDKKELFTKDPNITYFSLFFFKGFV